MPDIILTLSEEEQTGLISLVDVALRANGRGALKAAIHWEQKLAQAAGTATASSSAPVIEEKK